MIRLKSAVKILAKIYYFDILRAGRGWGVLWKKKGIRKKKLTAFLNVS